jgi:hypothetical protein
MALSSVFVLGNALRLKSFRAPLGGEGAQGRSLGQHGDLQSA